MENLRITSGKYRGQTIKSPGGATHPMGSREKIALFNMISPYLFDSIVLDAFSGSGALGIEAISRGAAFVYFVEKSKKACQIISNNIAKLDLKNTKLLNTDVSQLKNDLTPSPNIIIADPPYDNYDPKIIEKLANTTKKGDIFVLSHQCDPPNLPNLTLTTTKKYAKACISIYKNA